MYTYLLLYCITTVNVVYNAKFHTCIITYIYPFEIPSRLRYGVLFLAKLWCGVPWVNLYSLILELDLYPAVFLETLVTMLVLVVCVWMSVQHMAVCLS